MKDKELKYYNVPTYIEKAIKKYLKLKNQAYELILQIEDYKQTHNIPNDTPLELLKYIPEEEVDPNQMKFDLEDK